jgi:purine-binding chemotaxis protein CheW
MEKLSYLLFKLSNGVYYGFNIEAVQEVIEMQLLKVTADMPPMMAGFLELRGTLLPVLDIVTSLDFSESKFYDISENIVILQGTNPFGVIIPEGSNVINLEQASPISESLEASDQNSLIFSLLIGATKFEDESVFILDPDNLRKKLFSKENFRNQKITRQFDPKEKSIFNERAQINLRKIEKKEMHHVPLVIVLIHEEYFGIDPTLIVEFCDIESYSSIPDAPSYILGYMNLRGNALLLLDIWPLIQTESTIIHKYSQIVIIKKEELLLGILVDSVVSVSHLHQDEFRPVPIGVKNYNEEITTGTVKYKQNILSVLDLPKIINSVLINKNMILN